MEFKDLKMHKKFLSVLFLFFSGGLSNKLNAGYFQNIQPRNETEFYLYGGGLGSASTLCDLMVANKISFTTAKTFKKNFLSVFKNDKRQFSVVKGGFDDGLSVMREEGNEYKNCNF